MSDLIIRDVRKSFGDVEVLKGVDIKVADGELVALVGPSGCGKSTLLRMIAGLESTTHGDIVIGGRVVNDVPSKDRDIAMVFQSYALYPHMTVAQNMGFSLRLKRMSKAEITASVGRAAAILGLEALLDRYPRQLSGGQRQRVAMGRAIVRNPQVFLFDEPLSNLDAKLRVQMRAEIKELHQRLKTTTVYVTHDQVEAMTLADRVVVMNGGKIEQLGSPLDLYDRPETVFVAGFIGSPAMNLIQGLFERNADGASVQLDDGQIIGVPDVATIEPGSGVTVGIRPEHLALADSGLAATVSVVEPTGAETLVLARIEGGVIQIALRDRPQVGPGDVIHLTAQPRHIHLFDGASGQRLQ